MEKMIRTILAAFLLVGAATLEAGEFTAKSAESPPPKEISDSIRAVLDAKSIQLHQDGKPLMEFWPRKEVPLKSGAATLDSIAETTLVGALAICGQGLRDYKDNDLPEGIYTARYLLQPQDGDHLGTAEFNYFLVLVPADSDKELGGLDKFKPLSKASGKVTPSGHPAIISLRPVKGDSGTVPAVTEPISEHKALRLKLATKGAGGEKGELPVDMVFEGHGHIQ